MVEQWYVKVLFCNGNIIETRINGAKSEIEEYYASGKEFNLGNVCDKNAKVDKILEIRKGRGRNGF